MPPLKPIVMVIPGAHLKEKDDVELKEDWLEFGFYEIQKKPNKEIAALMERSENTVNHIRTAIRKETGCKCSHELCMFFNIHGLADKKKGAWTWVRLWKKSPYLLKVPLKRHPKRGEE